MMRTVAVALAICVGLLATSLDAPSHADVGRDRPYQAHGRRRAVRLPGAGQAAGAGEERPPDAGGLAEEAGEIRGQDALSELMRWATQAAPYPLSMLTTPTPAAQELSIASSAESPPKLAP